MSSERDHYLRNHARKPHEHLINHVNPEGQQSPNVKNGTAYIFLYIALAAAGFLLLLMIYGVWRDHRKKSRERNNEKKLGAKNRALFGVSIMKASNVSHAKSELNGGGSIKSRSSNGTNLYTTGTTSAGGSVPSMSTIPEEVQPPGAQDPHLYPNNGPHSQQNHYVGQYQQLPDPNHTQRPPLQNTNQPTSYPDLKSEEHRQNSVDDSARAPPRRQESRKESFPFAEYGMPPEDREPRTARVENMRPLSHFLTLSPGDNFYQLDEEEYSQESSSSSETSPLRDTTAREVNNGQGTGPSAPQDHDGQGHYSAGDTLPLRGQHQK